MLTPDAANRVITAERESYNQPIPHMRGRLPVGLRLTPLLVLTVLLAIPARASTLTDSAQLLAHKIAATTGVTTITLEVRTSSSLDERSVRDVRSALEAQLRSEGVHIAKAEVSEAAVQVTLSESLRERVWSAEITAGSGETKVVLVSLPLPPAGATGAAASPIVLRKALLSVQEQPILDAAQVELNGEPRLLLLSDNRVSVHRPQGARWELETALPIPHARNFPRDLRGRLMLRRDHLFDVYLPGVFCQSNANAPLALTCSDSDDPWPLTSEENGVRAFYASARNFFTGVLSPGIGRIANVPAFYSAAVLPRSGYALWVVAAVDGSVHLVDGNLDQTLGSAHWGSDLATVRSGCGSGTQLLATGVGDSEHDSLRAYEIPERDVLVAGAALEFDGPVTALWTENTGGDAVTVVKREDTGWYEAYRVSVSCSL